MKSKELTEILNKTRRTPNISLTLEQVEELIKDLERLEELEKYESINGQLDAFKQLNNK